MVYQICQLLCLELVGNHKQRRNYGPTLQLWRASIQIVWTLLTSGSAAALFKKQSLVNLNDKGEHLAAKEEWSDYCCSRVK